MHTTLPTATPRRILGALLACAAFALPATGAFAQGRPVSVVIPFGPGGATDFIARVMQNKLAEKLGQPVVIDNRPGAGGVLATNHVAKSAPDGHVLFQSWDTHTINPLVIKDLPYDTFKDFAPVTMMVRLPLIMGAWAPLPANTLGEFIALAKSQPGKLNFASIGAGSSTRLHAELLNSLAGIKVVHIPYKGGGPAMQAMITGEVAYGFFSLAAMKGHFQSGKLKPLAVTGTKRMAELPNVPTMAESGFPGYEAYSWIAIYAPAGTPEAVIARLNKAYAATLNDPEVNKRLVAAGMEVVASSPQQLADFQRKDYEKWVKFTREAKLKFDEK